MFENRNRIKKRNTLVLIVAIILAAAFGFGYYLNFGGSTDIGSTKQGNDDIGKYKIPESIRDPGPGILIPNADSNDTAETPESPDTPVGMLSENLITPSTKIIFKTYYTLCSHMQDKALADTKALINKSQAELKSVYADWTINEFSPQQVILKREIQTYCPRHFIIGSKGGYIAIYVYNEEGVKTLYEMTDSPISILTTEDQKNLEYGIVADNEEELQQKLEGLGE